MKKHFGYVHFLLILVVLIPSVLLSVEFAVLQKKLNENCGVFNYPLSPVIIEGAQSDEDPILCCHGYGGNNSIASILYSQKVVKEHLVAFNLPDYRILELGFDPKTVTHGTIEELLPALYLLKKLSVDCGAQRVSLYGFSAGGGVVINLIAVLNQSEYDQVLETVGIREHEKRVMLDALQKGTIYLDAPLKSLREICEGSRGDRVNLFLAEQYRINEMEPIDNLAKWQGLTLNVNVFFQNPDNAVLNRDDALFEKRLLAYNPKGKNRVIIKDEGGHCGFHRSLWK